MRRLDKSIKTFLIIFALASFVYFLIFSGNLKSFNVSKVFSAFSTIALLLGTTLSLVELTTGAIEKFSSKKQKVELESSKRKMTNGLVGLIIFASIWFIMNIFQIFFGLNLPAFTLKHFRTNIITGRCNYGGQESVVSKDPWYYKPDCDLEEKIKIAKEEGFYNERYNECSEYCRNDQKDYFCNVYIITVGDAWGNGPENLLCSEIFDCPQIDCVAHQESGRSK